MKGLTLHSSQDLLVSPLQLLTTRFSHLAMYFLLTVLTCVTSTIQAQVWEYLGLPNQQITSIVVRSPDTIYAATYALAPGTVFRTTNGGSTWDTVVYLGRTLDLKMHPRNPEILYAALGGSVDPPYGLLKTIDGGNSWFDADSGIYVDWEHSVYVVEVDPAHPETLYAGTGGPIGGDLYKSTNGGTSWTTLGNLESVASIAIHPELTETLFAGTVGVGAMLKTTDGGVTWDSTGLHEVGIVDPIVLDPVDYFSIYAGVTAGSAGGLQKSTDGGISWAMANSGLPEQSQAGNIVIQPKTRVVYAAVGAVGDVGGVYRSTDLGGTWFGMEGLPSGNRFNSLALSPDVQDLYVGVRDYGVYRTSITTDVTESLPLPDARVILHRNYPNPFNSSTMIQYELGKAGGIIITITDLLGREVANVAQATKLPGRYRVLFDGKALPTGAYYFRLSTSFGESVARKMLLIR